MPKPPDGRSAQEKLLKELAGAKQLKEVLPLLRKDLVAAGLDVDAMLEALSETDSLYDGVKELIALPDRFNAHFISRA